MVQLGSFRAEANKLLVAHELCAGSKLCEAEVLYRKGERVLSLLQAATETRIPPVSSKQAYNLLDYLGGLDICTRAVQQPLCFLFTLGASVLWTAGSGVALTWAPIVYIDGAVGTGVSVRASIGRRQASCALSARYRLGGSLTKSQSYTYGLALSFPLRNGDRGNITYGGLTFTDVMVTLSTKWDTRMLSVVRWPHVSMAMRIYPVAIAYSFQRQELSFATHLRINLPVAYPKLFSLCPSVAWGSVSNSGLRPSCTVVMIAARNKKLENLHRRKKLRSEEEEEEEEGEADDEVDGEEEESEDEADE
jgi:hypothetical protein